jgi:hemerythrin-like domain-containing protein
MDVDPGSDACGFFETLTREHAAIEQHLRDLDRAAESASRAQGDAAALDRIALILRFFAREGALHEEHEELTLFPRLRPLRDFRQILSAMEFQHRMNADAERELAAFLEDVPTGAGRELRRLAGRFAELQRGHAIAEERAVFPLAAAALTPGELAEMARELRERRGAAGLAGHGAR